MKILICPDVNASGTAVDEIMEMLPPWRREHILLSKGENDRLNGAAAFLLLKRLLKAEYRLSDVPKFTYGEKGKPFLGGFPDISISLSHCRGAAAAAVSGSPCGVDVLDKRPVRIGVAEKICCEKELELLKSCADKESVLLRMMSIKESRSKMSGEGFTGGFARFDTSAGADFILDCGSFFVSGVNADGESVYTEIVSFSELIGRGG